MGDISISRIFKNIAAAWSDHKRKPLRAPGLRTVKTSLAVFLCLMLYYFLLPDQLNVLTACIAAIISLKGNMRESRIASFVRLQSTFVGAVFGLIILQVREWTRLDYDSLSYYILLSLFVVLVIWISVSFLRSDGAVLGSIVLLIIAIEPILDKTPFQAAAYRMIDTLIGVGIGLLTNHLLPFYETDKEEIAECNESQADNADKKQEDKDD